MSIHLYTKIWANMRTCYCNGVTSDPPGPAAVVGPGLGAGPGVRSGVGPRAELGAGAGPGASTGPGAGPGGASTGPRPFDLSRCNVSHVWTIKNVTSVISRAPAQRCGRISDPGATATVASRVRSNGDGCISAQNESAPAGHLGGGAQIALCYKAQLSKTTPRYRGS